MTRLKQWLCVLPLCVLIPAQAAVSVTDDTGRTVSLAAPARRIVSLAPHATELLFAAGAGAQVVGVSEYSDFPPEARRLPIVGNAFALDLERIVALRPDLIVVWRSGNTRQVDHLRSLGIPVYLSEPHDFATIAASLEKLGRLAGDDAAGARAERAFHARLDKLENTYRNRSPVTVFYQISRAPLMTLNGQHLVSAAIRLCGGVNVFAHLQKLAPTVDVESVLQADPQAIIASNDAREDPFSAWRRFPRLAAVARGNLLTVDAGLLNRASPRVLDGVDSLCKRLDEARQRGG